MTKEPKKIRTLPTGLSLFVLCIATLMSSIDTTIVNISLPTIAKDLNTSFANVQWIALSYLIAVTALIVSIGKISDIFGKRKIFIFGIFWFTISSFLCGLAPNITLLILFRFFQGIGGAILTSLSFALIGDLMPPEKLTQGMGVLTAMLPVGIALGPTVGGILISFWSWNSIFFFNVPIGIAALILVLRFPDTPPVTQDRRVDITGIILLAVTLTCYVLAITSVENSGFGPSFAMLLLLAVAGLIVFLIRQRRCAYPLIELSMFKSRVFSGSMITAVILYTVISGANLVLPFYLQQGKAYSTFESGLLMASGPAGCALFSIIAGKVAQRFGSRRVMTCGVLAFAIGAFAMSFLGEKSSPLTFAVLFFLFDGSLAFFQTPNNTVIISQAKPEQRGLSSGLMNLARNIGQVTGSALIGAIFYTFTGTRSMEEFNAANTSLGVRNTFIIAGCMMLAAFAVCLFSLRQRKSDPVPGDSGN